MTDLMKFKSTALLMMLIVFCGIAVFAQESSVPVTPAAGSNAPDAAQPVAVEVQTITTEPTAAPVITVSAPNEVPADGTEPALEGQVRTSIEQRMQKVISVDFRNTPIEDVIRVMAEQAEVDIIKSPNVTGNVTATLKNVPLQEALSNILAAHGYGYIADKNMVRIAPIAELNQTAERLISRIYRVTYADVTEVEKALQKFLSPQGSLSSNASTSNIIVTDVESKIKGIDTFITEIDRITPQIMVEARIYDISCTDRLDLGINWLAGTNTTFGSASAGGTKTGKTDGFAAGAFSSTVDKATSSSNTIRFGVLNDSISVDAIIKAEQENLSAKLLANPRLMVLDNREAIIKIIEEIPFQQLTETSAGGTIGTTEFREVGVELTVTPHLTRDGMIRLKLNPKFSVVTGDVVIPGTNLTSPQPIVATREENTTALIRDGQTVVIGGLRKQDTSRQVNKVPLLGDIPLLGWAFRFEGEKNVTSELVVFITPHLIEQPVLSASEMRNLADTEIPSPTSPTLRLDVCDDKKCNK